MRTVQRPLEQHQVHQHSHHRGPGGEDQEKSIENESGEIVDENFPNLKKETDLEIQ